MTMGERKILLGIFAAIIIAWLLVIYVSTRP